MKIYSQLKNFLFFDIETVRGFKDHAALLQSGRSAHNWERVAARFIREENLTVESAYDKKAALYVEYGKIVSLAFGIFEGTEKKIYAMGDPDEKTLLLNVAKMFNTMGKSDTILCGHNIKEFDIPYIIKRMIIHKITLPSILLNYLAAKTWEQKATDTQYDWRMAGNRFMNLDTIAECLGIASSKDGEVNGESLGEYYWNHTDPMQLKIQKINTYCKEDVRVLMDFSKHIYDILPSA